MEPKTLFFFVQVHYLAARAMAPLCALELCTPVVTTALFLHVEWVYLHTTRCSMAFFTLCGIAGEKGGHTHFVPVCAISSCPTIHGPLGSAETPNDSLLLAKAASGWSGSAVSRSGCDTGMASSAGKGKMDLLPTSQGELVSLDWQPMKRALSRFSYKPSEGGGRSLPA